MKKFFFLLLTVTAHQITTAQNVGIGTTNPSNKLELHGNFVVSAPAIATVAAPSAGQTITMINGTTLAYSSSDSTGRFYDPGGPTGNYIDGQIGHIDISFLPIPIGTPSIGYEIIIENIDLGLGDYIRFKQFSASTDNLLELGNGYNTPGRWVFNTSNLHITFFSFNVPTTPNNGAGFSILFRRLYQNTNSLPDNIRGFVGNSFFVNTKTGAIRGGRINTSTQGTNSVALGNSPTASGDYAVALGSGALASGNYSVSLGGGSSADGDYSAAFGRGTTASGSSSTTMGIGTISKGYAGAVIGMYNDTLLAANQTTPTSTTPLLIVGNGDNVSSRSNALVVLKNGTVGIGTNAPDADMHIRHTAGGGLILENANDANQWRIYSASGDNNLTSYNNAGTEIADIDDVTGIFNTLSDMRVKKNIQGMKPVLPLLMQLHPAYYHFNWQQPNEQLQIGMLAQEAHKFFPELVSYNKTNDVYKMNYAGFSTVAIKAIQEQQIQIQNQQKQIDELKALVKQLLNK